MNNEQSSNTGTDAFEKQQNTYYLWRRGDAIRIQQGTSQCVYAQLEQPITIDQPLTYTLQNDNNVVRTKVIKQILGNEMKLQITFEDDTVMDIDNYYSSEFETGEEFLSPGTRCTVTKVDVEQPMEYQNCTVDTAHLGENFIFTPDNQEQITTSMVMSFVRGKKIVDIKTSKGSLYRVYIDKENLPHQNKIETQANDTRSGLMKLFETIIPWKK